jgi:hypothetical protein
MSSDDYNLELGCFIMFLGILILWAVAAVIGFTLRTIIDPVHNSTLVGWLGILAIILTLVYLVRKGLKRD